MTSQTSAKEIEAKITAQLDTQLSETEKHLKKIEDLKTLLEAKERMIMTLEGKLKLAQHNEEQAKADAVRKASFKSAEIIPE